MEKPNQLKWQPQPEQQQQQAIAQGESLGQQQETLFRELTPEEAAQRRQAYLAEGDAYRKDYTRRVGAVAYSGGAMTPHDLY